MGKQPTNFSLLFFLRFIFLSGIFILPFVFWPFYKIPFEIPKVIFFQRWIEILGILGIVNLLVCPNVKATGVKKNRVVPLVLVIIFVTVAFSSSLLGRDFLKSFWGNYYRWDGLLTLFHLAILFFFLVLLWDKSWEEAFVKTVALSSLMLSLGVIFIGGLADFLVKKDILFLPIGKQGFDGVGFTFGQPNFLAGYLLITLPFVVFWLKKRGNFVVLGTTVALGAIFLTGSKAGILGALLLAIGGFFLNKKGLWTKRKLLLLAGVIFLIGVFAYAKIDKQNYFVAESRNRIYKKAFVAFTKKPVLGWGWANFDYAFDSVVWPIKFENDVYVDKAHSYFLEVLVTGGALGLILLLTLIGTTTKLLLEKKKNSFYLTLLVSFAVFVIHSQTNVISINEEIIFWTILGISSSLSSSG